MEIDQGQMEEGLAEAYVLEQALVDSQVLAEDAV